MKETASLFIIPTPIGNLEDITLRAIRLLKQVDLILAEDTRTSGRLLKHYEIQNDLRSYHSFNEHKIRQYIISILLEGKKVALITDAGTPGISDPGFLIVQACLENNIEVECLPGPTAFIPALIKSGLPMNRFCFEGFLPHKKGRKKMLDNLVTETRTMIFYESPHRLLKSLEDFIQYFGPDRKASVSRELTKKYEETINGSLSVILKYYQNNKIKGEFVVVIMGMD